MTSKLQPFERFGLTRDEFKALVKLHLKCNKTNSKFRSSDESPFYDWEATELKKIFELLGDNQLGKALVAAMMQLVIDDVNRQHIEKAAKLVPKPPRANTAGMFFAANVPLSKQSNCASI